jgi:hypothetical protein
VEYYSISGVGGGDNIHSTYNPAAYPTLILIAPDRSIVEQDIWPISSVNSITSVLSTYGLVETSCSTNAPEIQSDENSANHKLYPNPSNGTVYVAIENENLEQIQILDLTGRELKKINVTNSLTEVDISDYRKGMYFFRLVYKNETSVVRVVFE